MKIVVRLLAALLVVAFTAAPLFAQKEAVGEWAFTTMSPEGEFKSTLVIREEGGALKAFGKNDQGERPFDSIAVDGGKITLVITIPYNGSPLTITYTGKVDKAKMEGEADFGGMATGTWSAVAQK
ncbi:MAG TPA: hypothetical protein VEA16_02970 [Vicinamibacterales bacterium]|nr:hypothetical protein [Vicinamibacterales bacterium]